MPDRIKGITIEIGGDTTGLDKALKGVNQELKEAQNGLKDVNKLLKMDPGNIDLLRQKQGYLNDTIASTKEKLDKEKEALEQLKHSDGFDKNSEQAKALERQIIADEQALDKLEKEQKEFGSVGKQQLKVITDKYSELGKKIQGVGQNITKSVTLPILAAGAASVAAFNEVDEGMDIIIQKTGASGDALESMKRSAEIIATSIPTSFETAGTAIGEVNTRFGATGQLLEDLSTQFIKFAELNGTDVTSSIDQAQKALSAFGLGAEDAAALLDVLNATGQSTGASMDSLLSGLIQNGTAFQEMGLSIEQATVFMGQMETSGANSETVMQGLRKALKSATEEGIPLNQALANLQETILNGTGSVDGLTAAYDMFGKSGDQIYAAVKNGTLDFNALAISIDDVGGSVTNTFEATLDPIDQWKTAVNQAKLAGSDLGSAIQQAALPIMEKLSSAIQTVTEKFRSLSPEQQETIVKVGAIVAAVGPLITILGTLMISLTGIVAFLGGPLTLAITAAIAVVTGAIVIGNKLADNWDMIKQKGHDTWESIKESFRNGVDKLKSIMNFEWSLPHIKLPHFSLQGSFSLMPPSVPTLSVDWYKKAYSNPVMFTSPTVMQTPNGYKGFGDGHGAEIVMGLDKLRELVGTMNGGVTVIVNGAVGQDVRALAQEVERELVNLQNRRTAVWS